MIITETADDVKETAELKSLNPLIIGSMIITAPSINKIPAPSKYVLIPLSSGQWLSRSSKAIIINNVLKS